MLHALERSAYFNRPPDGLRGQSLRDTSRRDRRGPERAARNVIRGTAPCTECHQRARDAID